MGDDLRAHFPAGAIPRPEQSRLLDALAETLAAAPDDGPLVILIEAPPGVGKSHLAMTLAQSESSANCAQT